eukprot:3752004-Rhodomonas_salina.1
MRDVTRESDPLQLHWLEQRDRRRYKTLLSVYTCPTRCPVLKRRIRYCSNSLVLWWSRPAEYGDVAVIAYEIQGVGDSVVQVEELRARRIAKSLVQSGHIPEEEGAGGRERGEEGGEEEGEGERGREGERRAVVLRVESCQTLQLRVFAVTAASNCLLGESAPPLLHHTSGQPARINSDSLRAPYTWYQERL